MAVQRSRRGIRAGGVDPGCTTRLERYPSPDFDPNGTRERTRKRALGGPQGRSCIMAENKWNKTAKFPGFFGPWWLGVLGSACIG